MRSINFTGTGRESGKRIVPLLTLYVARAVLERLDEVLAGGMERVVLRATV
jgi:hypothetical protein